jgi:hypothetical protein
MHAGAMHATVSSLDQSRAVANALFWSGAQEPQTRVCVHMCLAWMGAPWGGGCTWRWWHGCTGQLCLALLHRKVVHAVFLNECGSSGEHL